MRALAFLIALCGLVSSAAAGENFIVLQSTTSTQNSGLFAEVLPQFEAFSGIEVRVVAVGTGQALRNAANGDGDALLVHAKSDEEEFVAQGFGVSRFDVMYNDFVIVGPAGDPAGVRTAGTAQLAFSAIAAAQAKFISRGDDSGTHKTERRLWTDAGLSPAGDAMQWYIETGSGMGATLNMASALGAYTLTDRGTWIAFGNKGDLAVVFDGDPDLFNQYGIIVVNPEMHPSVKSSQANQFSAWLRSAQGQAAIASFKVDGQQLFFPNARID